MLRLGLFFAFLPASLAADLRILPSAVTLTGPEARQQLLAESLDAATNADVTRKVTWTSSNPAIVKVENGIVTPVADGTAEVTATRDGAKASARVTVQNAKAPFTWSFRNHVIPVMTKTGCNQGACHGALAGKNGFKLTLRGYDPDVDFDTLTRQSVGRRISPADPAGSLVLQKATFATPHGGGRRFKPDSLEYRVIQEWIAAGTPRPADSDATITGLDVFPPTATLTTGAEQQIVVRAKYSDGHTEDVTRWVKFNSNNEGVATVDDWGRVKMNGHGEAAITCWYSSRVLYARLTVPYPNQIADAAYNNFPRKSFIDDLAVAKWKTLHIAPSKPADDAAFLRRAYLDAAGILPSAEEVENFLADTSANKREKLVDQLLARDEFTDYWAYKWSDLLLVSSKKLRPNAMWSFYNWIRESVAQNKPWDKFAKEIFTGTGSNRQHGELNYYVLHKDPIDLVETTTQAFLGQKLTCARCHNHPLEKWTQTQYYQMANLFSRVGLKNGSDGDNIVFAKTSGDINHPRLLKPLAPAPLDGPALSLDSQTDRRIAFANWLTSPDNVLFARTVVNRVWANFLGRGLVDPVDDVRLSNPASNEELFAALSKDFAAHGFDVKRLIRLIMTSSVYQLSSEANSTNASDNMYYSKYVVKRLNAEVILDAMSQVTGVATNFGGYPAGTRALQLPDTQIQSQFLSSFGRPARDICDAGERSMVPTVAQALHVLNGDTLNKKLSNDNGYIALFLKVGLSDRRIIEHLYLSAFSRYPNENEKRQVLDVLEKARAQSLDARRPALEDAVWAMLTSKEFLFNH